MPGHERFRFRDEGGFLKKIRELGVAIPFSKDFGPLFKKTVIAGRTLPNRIAVHPMEGADAAEDGSPSGLTFRRYRRFASGGSSLLWFEATAITPESRSNPRQLMLTEKTAGAFKRLVKKTRRAARTSGCGEDILCILQLTHAGRFSRAPEKKIPALVHRNPALDRLLGLPDSVPLLSDEELERLKGKFLSVAKLAASVGFDGVDVKACHGYLVSELLASHTRRDSRFGGPLENRIRFLVETLGRIASEIPGLLVTTRLGVYDGLPYPHGFGVEENDSSRIDLTEPKALIRELARLGLPLLSISLGVPALNPSLGRPYDLPLRNAENPGEHPLVGVARHIAVTAELQKEFPGLPILGAGFSWLRRFIPNVASAVLRQRKASLVGLGRGALAYPAWPSDLSSKKSLNPRRLCTACSRCSQLLKDGGAAGCVVRDKGVYAPEFHRLPKESSPRPASEERGGGRGDS